MRTRLLALPALLAVLALAGCGVASGTPAPKPAHTSSSDCVSGGDVYCPGDEMPQDEQATYTPTPDDFELDVKILERQCFGSAGCNVTYRVELGYGGPTLDPDTTYDITYEVRGVEDGPAINTLTATGDQYEADAEEFAMTSSPSRKLRAVVTDVEAE